MSSARERGALKRSATQHEGAYRVAQAVASPAGEMPRNIVESGSDAEAARAAIIANSRHLNEAEASAGK